MRNPSGARMGLALIVVPWLVAVAGYFVLADSGDEQCATDTECMQMHGGDGGPSSATECKK